MNQHQNDHNRPALRARALTLWRRYIRWWRVPYREWTPRRRTGFYVYAVTVALVWAIVANWFVLPAIDH